MKRVFSLIVTAAIAFSSVSAFAATGGKMDNFLTRNTYSQEVYSDIAPDSWYKNNVKQCYELALMLGDGNGNFNPEGYVTLAEAITMAARIYNIYYGGTGNFDTSVGTKWYDSVVNYAEKSGIIKAGQFSDYEKAASRAEMAEIFVNALPAEEFDKINNVEVLPDVPSDNARFSYIQKLYSAGIVVGSDTARNFKPDTNIKRSEAAAIICRMAVKSSRIKIEDMKAGGNNENNSQQQTDSQTGTNTQSGGGSSGGSSSSSSSGGSGFQGTSGKTDNNTNNNQGQQNEQGGEIITFTFENKAVSTAKITLTLTDKNGEKYPYETETDSIQTDILPIGKYTYSAETEGCKRETGSVDVVKGKDPVTVKFEKNVKEDWKADRIADSWGVPTYAVDLKESSGIVYFNFDGDLTGKEFDMSKARIGLVELDWINSVATFLGKDSRLSGSYTKVAGDAELVPGTYYTEKNPMDGTYLKIMLHTSDAESLNNVFDIKKIYDSQDAYTAIFAMEPDFYEDSKSQFIILEEGKRLLTINNFEEEPETYYMLDASETLVHQVYKKIFLALDCEKIIFSTLKRVPIKEVEINEDTLTNGVDFSEIHN